MGKAAKLSLAGALIAGCFGIVHDQITYTISPEYFTRMKFDQFQAADFGFPSRVFVAEIGFLATWWVGLIGAWFLARIAVRKFESPVKRTLVALAFVVSITVAAGVTGYFQGPAFGKWAPGWEDALVTMRVTDLTAFYRVAGIHIGSYLGAFIGWILAMVRFAKSPRELDPPPDRR